MPVDPDKRRLRETKRAVKKAGARHRRRDLKRQLEQNPEDAADHTEKLGRHRSEHLNGIDNDSTRKKEE
ncbi:MAG: hypothetical protein R3B84_16725 [Zavarzinella sp.]